MSSIELLNQFRFNQMVLTLLLKDVTQEDSLRVPASDANSINWMLGHLIAARGTVLKNTGAEPVWVARLAAPYARGNNSFPDGALPFAELNTLLSTSFDELTSALAAFEPRLMETCTERMPHLESGTWADRFGSFVCHEAYHIGQIGYVRRLLGKPGLF
jgi:hypothetical protein